ncbi:hypothetical protein LINPERHAP1_LOCUS5557 [Linum perenne]
MSRRREPASCPRDGSAYGALSLSSSSSVIARERRFRESSRASPLLLPRDF